MNKQERVALAIKEVVSKMMDRVMVPVLEEYYHSNKSSYTDTIIGNLGFGQLKRIQQVLNLSYYKNYEFDWEKEIKYILMARGQLLPVTVNCDIFKHIELIEGDLIFELKDSKPDMYKIRAIKENILKLIAMSLHK